MTRQELNEEYFEWMYNLVDASRHSGRSSYKKLFKYLNRVEFVYILAPDENRYFDGIDLRYRFCYEKDMPSSLIASYLDDKPCSILEMLVALSLRCEEHIMRDPDIGDRTSKWFWQMIDNLDLSGMNDSNFDIDKASEIVDTFLYRKYGHDGDRGGLFIIPHCYHDLRTTEIWYQMMWYLNDVLLNR